MLNVFRIAAPISRRVKASHCRSFSNFITPGDNAAFETLKVMDTKKVLYFTASWCPPCKVIGPVVEEMAKANPEITFVKIDIDELAEAAQYGNFFFPSVWRSMSVDPFCAFVRTGQIKSVPTFQFRDGQAKLYEV